MNQTEEKKSLFKETLESIENNKRNKDLGIYNSIPFGLPSLDKHVPGIMKGLHYGVTANSGVGKSQLAKYLFVLQPYKFIKRHPELGLKLKIFYIALEESKEEFMLNLICNRLREHYNITVSSLQLKSMGENTLSDVVLEKVKDCAEYFEELEESLEVIDSIYNPTGLYKHVRNYASANGVHWYRPLNNKSPKRSEVISSEQLAKLPKDIQDQYCYYQYEPNNPNEFVIVVNDHISLLATENTEDAKTMHLTISKWSTDYVRKMMTKRFGYCIADVQQQEMAFWKIKIFFLPL